METSTLHFARALEALGLHPRRSARPACAPAPQSIRALTAGRQLAAGWTAGGVGQLSHETMAGEARSMVRRQLYGLPEGNGVHWGVAAHDLWVQSVLNAICGS